MADDVTPYIKLNSSSSILAARGGSYSLQDCGTIPQAVCSLKHIRYPPAHPAVATVDCSRRKESLAPFVFNSAAVDFQSV